MRTTLVVWRFDKGRDCGPRPVGPAILSEAHDDETGSSGVAWSHPPLIVIEVFAVFV